MKWILLILFTNTMLMVSSQILEKHQWENRILLVIGEGNESSKDYSNQLKIINDSYQGFRERKLIVYSVLPRKHSLLDLTKNQQANWVQNPELYSTYNQENKPFKVVLIGLDGSTKEERTELFNSQDLFAIIDGMSMRKAEIRRKNNP
jgi:hypothetical protein